MAKKPTRLFNFSLSILLSESGKLQIALTEADYATALTERLKITDATAAADLDASIGRVNKEILDQSAQRGNTGTLTKEQNDALFDMRRLASGARRTAESALKGQTVVLHSEFQVGQSEDDSSLGAEVGRARKTHAASLKYATDLKREAWIASDSTLLGQCVEILSQADLDQAASLADGVEFTAAVTNAANALYTHALRVQNAARLQYPLPRPGVEIPSATVGARSRFLLESFPPRDRNTPDGNPTTVTPPTPPTP